MRLAFARAGKVGVARGQSSAMGLGLPLVPDRASSLGSSQLEQLQRQLRADGRDDLADSVLRIQVALEADSWGEDLG